MSQSDIIGANSDVVHCIENLPTYSDCFKFVLIEELVLEEDYRQLHYGKCRLIGKLLKKGAGEILLENVRICNLPREYSIAEGTLIISLLTFHNKTANFNVGPYVEVAGEVVLRNNQEPHENASLLTSRGVVEQLRFVRAPNDREKLLTHFKNNYKPALKVWFVAPVDRPSDLISRNLETRMLEQEIQSL